MVAVVSGFNAGLLRSIATIMGYLAAMPVAVAATPYVSRMLADKFNASQLQNPMLFFGIFLVTGIVLGALLRTAVSETVGPRISLPDRLAGSVLGAVRVVLVAVTMVLIFDRIIPLESRPFSAARSSSRSC
jgi:membrane protein required for colicin V production